MTHLVDLLQEFYSERLAVLIRHEATARITAQYDVNNTYQYIIAREEAQLSWVAQAITELGGTPASQADAGRRPAPAAGSWRAALQDDATDAQAFVDRWRPRVDAMGNARHSKMLRVILGEILEQKRFFEQALAGRTDLLGRHTEQAVPTSGEVLPTRWVE